MANILVTNFCNRGCPYCFAIRKIEREDESPADSAARARARYITLDDYSKVLAFLKRSKCEVASLLGGEPTLHPEFTRLVDMAHAEGLMVKVFTNGLMPEETARHLAACGEKVIVIVNMNHPSMATKQAWAQACRTLEILGARGSLSYNIFHAKCDFDFLISLILEHKLTRIVRFGVAMPVLGTPNVHLSLDDYKSVGRQLADFSDRCAPHDVSVRLDCGFTMCMFTDEELGRLKRNFADLHFRCDPIIDIGPDLNVWCCFPLAGAKNLPLDHFATRAEFVDYFNAQFSAFQSVGALPECLGCPQLRREQCCGGCLVHCIRSFNEEARYCVTKEGV